MSNLDTQNDEVIKQYTLGSTTKEKGTIDWKMELG